MGNTLSVVDLGSGRTAREIAIGYEHTCARLDTNEVKCWGRSNFGQVWMNSWQSMADVEYRISK